MAKAYGVAELLPGRTHTVGSTGLVESATEQYQILIDPANRTGDIDLSAVTGLPAIGSVHADYGIPVVGHDPAEDAGGGGLRWVVMVRYSRLEPVDPPRKVPKSGAIISRGWGSQSVSRELVVDASTDEPLLNSAGEAFASVPQVDHAMPVYVLEKRVSGNPNSYLAASGKVNSDALSLAGVTVAARCGKLTVTADQVLGEGLLNVWNVRMELAVMWRPVKIGGDVVDVGWDEPLVQMGYYYLSDDTPPVLLRATEADQETRETRPTEQPVLLDANGKRTDTPVVVRVKTHKETAMAGLLT